MKDAIGRAVVADPTSSEHEIASSVHSADISLLTIVNVFLSRIRLITISAVATLILFTALSLLQDPSFEAESVFMPEVGDRTGQLAGLAAQFGIPVDGASSRETLEFYAELLSSSELLRELALTEFRITAKDEPQSFVTNLVELYGADDTAENARIRSTVEQLRSDISVTSDASTGLVTVKTSARWPALAVDINERLLRLLNSFNMKRRQTRAAAESSFLEARVLEAQQELEDAEAELEEFLKQNRRYDESPQLMFESARLQRRIDVRQQVFLSLSQSYEQARVGEVRNTPVITIVDSPGVFVRKTGPHHVRFALLGVLLGAMMGSGLALFQENLERRRRASPAEYARFLRLRNSLLGRLRRTARVSGGSVS